jgi:hypothetical protein
MTNDRMSDTPKSDAMSELMHPLHGVEAIRVVRLHRAQALERELTKAINCARFMAAYLEDRGEASGRAYALCKEIGWPDQS